MKVIIVTTIRLAPNFLRIRTVSERKLGSPVVPKIDYRNNMNEQKI